MYYFFQHLLLDRFDVLLNLPICLIIFMLIICYINSYKNQSIHLKNQHTILCSNLYLTKESSHLVSIKDNLVKLIQCNYNMWWNSFFSLNLNKKNNKIKKNNFLTSFLISNDFIKILKINKIIFIKISSFHHFI